MTKPFLSEEDLDIESDFLDCTLGELCDEFESDRLSVFLSPRDPDAFSSFADAMRHLRTQR